MTQVMRSQEDLRSASGRRKKRPRGGRGGQYILLDELTADNANEASVGAVGDSSSEERLSRA